MIEYACVRRRPRIPEAGLRPIGTLTDDKTVRVVDERGADVRLEKTGYAGAWGIEVLSAELRPRPLEETVMRAYKTTIAQFRG